MNRHPSAPKSGRGSSTSAARRPTARAIRADVVHAGTLSEAGGMAYDEIAAVGQIAGWVRAPARPRAGGNIRTAEVGGVERTSGDVDECVGGVRVDRYPPARTGIAVRFEAGGVLGRGQQVGPV